MLCLLPFSPTPKRSIQKQPRLLVVRVAQVVDPAEVTAGVEVAAAADAAVDVADAEDKMQDLVGLGWRPELAT